MRILSRFNCRGGFWAGRSPIKTRARKAVASSTTDRATHLNFRYRAAREAVLSDIIARAPRASLQEIRQAHPAFQRISQDQLGLRVSRLLEQRAAHDLK